MSIKLVTYDRLRELFFCDIETGTFTRKINRQGNWAGEIAGHVRKDGRRVIGIDGRSYLAYRLVWLYAKGSWPDGEIDHINLDSADNGISNLRIATSSQNRANMRAQPTNKSGVKGVCWAKREGKWRATINVRGKHIHVGFFNSIEDAGAAYISAAKKHFGEFARAA